ncbi:cytochrome P450 [Wolfiporia cocos MD-104 SS10]|uniref:Cytochrome P450 n=1 Tax=Wolfiporia cocos (strain MD-104) TaxID=742152 RepID=A0A2H3JK90_WOLCO|nr:cytochrome P450 [Wolfiporia cocos MD-104 SS10]
MSLILHRTTQPPPQLRDIPRIPVWPLLLSYISGEVEERRVKRLLLPFARQHQADIVLLLKQTPPADMLLWRFTGRHNVFFAEGEQWQKHSRIVKAALQRTNPLEQFAHLCSRLCGLIGSGGRVRWNDLSHRFTLDAVGTTVLGYEFEALDKPEGSLITQYHLVMSAISSPLYVFVGSLEQLLPRHKVRREVDALVDKFFAILAAKKTNPGNDIITFMLEEPNMTDQELRDNIVILFMAAHDSTAGTMSSLIYYLGKYPEVQSRARAEVNLILRPGDEVMVEHLSQTPYLRAIIFESMRLNNPANVTLPRVADVPVNGLIIPPETPIFLNMCAVLHNERYWEKPSSFNPERFMDGDTRADEGNWTPFGLGPRQCPARKFSLTEQRFLTAMLLREYEWTIPTDSIHINGIRNAFSPFAINAPFDMDIDFRKL